MPYAILQDMINSFSEEEILRLSPDDEAITRVLADADALINGYLGGRYALPLAQVPPMLTLLACDIAFYRLHSLNPTEIAEKRYNDAVKTLRDIADGRIKLQLDGINEAPQGSAVVMTDAPPKIFTHNSMKEF
jgi:phage gp36-like protein